MKCFSFLFNRLDCPRVACLSRVGSILDRVTSKTSKLVVTASPISAQYTCIERDRLTTVWLGVPFKNKLICRHLRFRVWMLIFNIHFRLVTKKTSSEDDAKTVLSICGTHVITARRLKNIYNMLKKSKNLR